MPQVLVVGAAGDGQGDADRPGGRSQREQRFDPLPEFFQFEHGPLRRFVRHGEQCGHQRFTVVVEQFPLLHQSIDAGGLVDVPLPLGLRDDVHNAEDGHREERAAGDFLRHLTVEVRREERQFLRMVRSCQHTRNGHDGGALEVSGKVVIHADVVPEALQFLRGDGPFPLEQDGSADRVQHALFSAVGVPQSRHVVDEVFREVCIPFDHGSHPVFLISQIFSHYSTFSPKPLFYL